jgi:hypothetical protein
MAKHGTNVLQSDLLKIWGSGSVFFQVYTALNSDDLALLKMSLTTALRTRIFVRRAAILDLLPIGLNNNWPYSGRVMDHGTIGP